MTTNAAVTNDFVAGTTISSSAVDQNFSDILSFLNATGVGVYQAGSVGTAAITDGAVTGAKLASTMSGDRAWTGVNTMTHKRNAIQRFPSVGTGSGALGTIDAAGGCQVSIFTGGTVSIILPAAVAGMHFVLVKTSSASLTVSVQSGEYCNGTLNGTLASALRMFDAVCVENGSWVVSAR